MSSLFVILEVMYELWVTLHIMGSQVTMTRRQGDLVNKRES